jgi:signal transduction histidine kinase
MTGKPSNTESSLKEKEQGPRKKLPTLNMEDRKARAWSESKLPAEFDILKDFAETTSDLFFVLNPVQEKINYLNKAGKKFLEITDTNLPLLQSIFSSSFPASGYKKLNLSLLHSWKNGQQGGEMEIRLLKSNGETNYFNLHYSLLQTKNRDRDVSFLCQCRNITPTKQYVKELQISKLKLQMALDGSSMGIWSYDPKSRTFDCDERTNQIFGVSPKEIRSEVNPYFMRIHSEDRAYAILTAFSTLRQKGRFNHEFRVIPADSKLLKHVALVGEFIHDEKSGTTKITGVCTDITHHKLAENKLRTNETFLEESQRIAKIGSFDWDLLLDKVNLTRQMFDLLDIQSEEDFNMDEFYARIHPSYLPEVRKVLMEAIKKGENFSHEFIYRLAGKKERYYWAQGQVISYKENRTTRLIGSIQDITERKEKENELSTQGLIIRSMLDHLPVIILIVDKAGIVRSLLGSGLASIGLKENETVGQSIFEQYPPVGKYVRKVLQGQSQHFSEELEINGQLLHFLSYYFYDKERELAIGFSLNITAQRETEEAYQQVSAKNMELERGHQLMDMFVHAVAHDLKNPVNNLEMLSSLITDASTPQERQEYFGALEKSVSRLKHTIKGLTEVVEVESHWNLQARRLAFKDILEQVKEELGPLMEEKGARLELNFKQSHITYNEAFLRSILLNLISNALKYSHEKRPSLIRISTEKQSGYVLLTVADNGIGMNLDSYGDKLFLPFKRFTKQAEGTGIGLHLIRNIIEKNGGYIKVESIMDKGSVFKCYLLPYKRTR